jgi:hypothetical protein
MAPSDLASVDRSTLSCAVVPLRPANPTPLEKAIFKASDEWFLSERAGDSAASSAKSQKKYLDERDAHRKECGRQLAKAKRLHAETKINVPWKEWAPRQTGWSYMTITRRMKDFAEPDAPKQRDQKRARQSRVTTSTKVVTLPSSEPVAQQEPTLEKPASVEASSSSSPDDRARLRITVTDDDLAVPAEPQVSIIHEPWEVQADAIRALAADQFVKFKKWFLLYMEESHAAP